MGIPDPEGQADVTASAAERPVAHAYYCRTDSLKAHQTDAAEKLLSAEERRRCRWLFRDTDRRDYVAAHVLLRAALSVHTEIDPDLLSFEKDAAGRPSLVRPEGQVATKSFSLSHTVGLVACVIASDQDAPGIDVEAIDRSIDVETLASLVCSTGERARLRDCSAITRHTRFFELWTLKEAFLKAQGAGLAGMSMLPSFRVEGKDVCTSGPLGTGGRLWSFRLDAIGATHVLAVALARRGARVSVRMIAVNPVAAMTGAFIPMDRRANDTLESAESSCDSSDQSFGSQPRTGTTFKSQRLSLRISS